MFITYLPGDQHNVELWLGQEGPWIYDRVLDKVLEIKRTSPHAKYWLGALKSKRWDRVKLRVKEQEALELVIDTLEGK